MRLKTMLAALLFSAFALRAGAAVVTLKDGSTLHGKVLGQTSDAVELATPDGTLHVGVDRILRIDYAEAPALPLDLPLGQAAPAPGTSRVGRQLVSLGFSLAEPLGRVNFKSIGGGSADNGDLGSQFSLQYLYFLTPRLGAGLDLAYIARSGTVSEGLYPNASSSVNGDTWLMLGIVRWSFLERGRWRPFVLVGAGGARNSETVDVRPANWADTNTDETRRLVDDSAWVPAASARLGFDVDIDALAPGVVTFEAGWTGLGNSRYASTPRGAARGLSGISGPLSFLTFTARYGWRF